MTSSKDDCNLSFLKPGWRSWEADRMHVRNHTVSNGPFYKKELFIACLPPQTVQTFDKNIQHYTTKIKLQHGKEMWHKTLGVTINVVGTVGLRSNPLIQGHIGALMRVPSHWRRSTSFGKEFAALILGSKKQVRLWQKCLAFMKAWQRSNRCSKGLEIRQTKTSQRIMMKVLALASI